MRRKGSGIRIEDKSDILAAILCRTESVKRSYWKRKNLLEGEKLHVD